MEIDYLVIGAGAAGLSFAALMEKRGYKVVVLEAHTLPGGCSSYFERDGFIFDAGATTLSGLKKGRPLQRLIAELDLKLEIKAIDPSIILMVGDKKIRRFRNQYQWIEELIHYFPEINHQKLWGRLSAIDALGWSLSTHFKKIPLRSIFGVFSFFTKRFPGALQSLPALFKSVDDLLKEQKIANRDYLAMINELLFITAQNKSFDTPLLMGAMGLSYPEDTGYAIGGMKAFSVALASKCSNLYFRHEVKKIKPIEHGKKGFEVLTNKKNFFAKNIISTIPVWNHSELFEDANEKDFFKKKNVTDPANCWSAFMIYLTIPLDQTREGYYYQIHCEDIPNCSTRSFFVSISHKDDHTRSILNRQVVTISTHTKTSNWVGLTNEEYQLQKEKTQNFILDILKIKLNLESEDLHNIMTGTPKTFIKYTKRYGGLVGGIPYSLKRNPLDLLLAKSPCKNFYMLGDTQFPGQGIAAVILGSMNLVDYLD